jgi:hypothetical protein
MIVHGKLGTHAGNYFWIPRRKKALSVGETVEITEVSSKQLHPAARTFHRVRVDKIDDWGNGQLFHFFDRM